MSDIKILKNEADSLARAVIKRYKELRPDSYSNFNTYEQNYIDLQNSIKAITGVHISEKTLIKLLLNHSEFITFRKSVIDAFYNYSNGEIREFHLNKREKHINSIGELFKKEYQLWVDSRYNYLVSINTFSLIHIYGIENNLTSDEYKFLLMMATYYGHYSFHYFFHKNGADFNALTILYKLATDYTWTRVKWRIEYLLSQYPIEIQEIALNELSVNIDLKQRIASKNVETYLESLIVNDVQLKQYATEVLGQIRNRKNFCG